jgi:hypothetical protein
MDINREKNLVYFKPENDNEAAALEKVWRFLISCTNETKKLCPVGEYFAGSEKGASFYIEGMDSDAAIEVAEEFENIAAEAGTYYCATCNKYVTIEAGAEIPLCCGLRMQPID